MSIFSQDRYVEALRYAAEVHGSQRLPGTDLPYLVHLCTVTMEVIAAITTEPVEAPDLAVVCALLHDTIEDTSATYEDLARQFGPQIADGVLALTKDPELAKEARMPDSLQRLPSRNSH